MTTRSRAQEIMADLYLETIREAHFKAMRRMTKQGAVLGVFALVVWAIALWARTASAVVTVLLLLIVVGLIFSMGACAALQITMEKTLPEPQS